MIQDGKKDGGLAKRKTGAIAPKVEANTQAQAQEAFSGDPIAGVDSLREQILSKVAARTEGLAEQDAQFLANQPAHYLGQLTQRMGTAEVVPVDGFLDHLDRLCSGTVHPAVEVGVGAE
jgi:hypothetical protein